MRLFGLILLALSLVLAPLAAQGQPPGKVSRIGHVAPVDFDRPERMEQRSWPAFVQGLSSLGWMGRERDAAVLIWNDPAIDLLAPQLLDLAVKHRLPTIVDDARWARIGALIGYGPKADDLYRQAATRVDRILRGAKPADLPIGQPTTFELICNLKTAKALGLTIPQSILLLADQVVE